MSQVFKDKQGNKLFLFGNKAYGKTKENKIIPKGKVKQLIKEYQKVQREKLEFGKPIDLGKELDLGKGVDFGKPIDLGKELDLGI